MVRSRNIVTLICAVLFAVAMYLSVSVYVKSSIITDALSKQCLDENSAHKLEFYAKTGDTWLFSTISDKLSLCGDYRESNRLTSLGRRHGNSAIYLRDALRIEREISNNIENEQIANVETRIETALSLLDKARRNNVYSFYDVRFGAREQLSQIIDQSARRLEYLRRETN